MTPSYLGAPPLRLLPLPKALRTAGGRERDHGEKQKRRIEDSFCPAAHASEALSVVPRQLLTCHTCCPSWFFSGRSLEALQTCESLRFKIGKSAQIGQTSAH